eukprot:TRINITY_DN1798_c5_g1_i1.p1 TRINITY_DN1798_c5_g1~~TRINITY_DN1798_c5_g1_i1.p1  ORF type:complete len:719 (+),score=182.09 TRINITY_DN1798_c5_g1_i1:43-2199(+)
MRAPPWLVYGLPLLAIIDGASGAGGLWVLGNEVDQHPATVFVMFVAIVGLTVAVELVKHWVEHRTHDPYRVAALEALYQELMMLGVVSFFLTLGAELGLTQVKFGCIDPEPAPAPIPGFTTPPPDASGSGSGSGYGNCEYGFDIALFQFSHLVLFSMGLFHFVWVQVAFVWRGQFAKQVEDIQQYTATSWKSVAPGVATAKAAYQMLHLRAAMVIEYGDRMGYICDARAAREALELAELDGDPAPPALPNRDDAGVRFDFAKYIKLMYSEMLLELIHPPVWIWLAGLLLSVVFLSPVADLSLSVVFIPTSAVGPIFAVVTWWQIGGRYENLCKAVGEHPNAGWHEYHTATAHPEVLKSSAVETRPEKVAPEPRYAKLPWQKAKDLSGCGKNGLYFYRTCMQVSIFCNCLYLGKLCFLTPVIWRKYGALMLALAWLVPLIPFFHTSHQAIKFFVLVFLTEEPSLANLKKTLQDSDPHAPPHHDHHGHGHGQDDHGSDHGSTHSSRSPSSPHHPQRQFDSNPLIIQSSPPTSPGFPNRQNGGRRGDRGGASWLAAFGEEDFNESLTNVSVTSARAHTNPILARPARRGDPMPPQRGGTRGGGVTPPRKGHRGLGTSRSVTHLGDGRAPARPMTPPAVPRTKNSPHVTPQSLPAREPHGRSREGRARATRPARERPSVATPLGLPGGTPLGGGFPAPTPVGGLPPAAFSPSSPLSQRSPTF